MATDYTLNQNGLPIIEANNNDISFMLYNKGGYKLICTTYLIQGPLTYQCFKTSLAK